jgi:hypothetical protein
MDQHEAIEWFMATNDGTAIDSWHWFIEWTTTSFYIKAMSLAAQLLKVSMHGPDPRPQHKGKAHFRLDRERTNQDRAASATIAGGRWLYGADGLPLFFEGQPINDQAKLIVRFSTGPDLFLPGAPPAGPSDWPLQHAMKGLVPLPEEGRVRHVDVFLSYNGEPYWPDAEEVRISQSGMGYIRNSLDWCLSAVIYDRPVDYLPDPFGDLRDGAPVDQCARGVIPYVDDNSLLWLCERLIPFDQLD